MTHRATSMVLSHAIIRVTNLRLRTYIGFNPEEQQKQQDVIINMEIHYPANKSFETDNVDDALNYKTITKRVIQHVEKGRFQLLEKLVSDLLAIVGEHPSVMLARVTVDKPHALRFADSVSLTLESRAKPSTE
ncbi:MAG: dihydroneopterin triphosphate 2'-epimerase [Shewanella sp.]|nr:dihydroneopterin triphosphate 2'-epimerase [Shewanella sp.]MCF1430064.1 dihydroneopterin triphosphate 2'-epimerase [Shewanella sp.]MCF1439207.1 dihydroneopterin triphosphate 2'-epimerase [Shewanella sp.]MCF1458545.1 dihydroneopterin triphosphate 2'-epimerase [Shewanella sp.]